LNAIGWIDTGEEARYSLIQAGLEPVVLTVGKVRTVLGHLGGAETLTLNYAVYA